MVRTACRGDHDRVHRGIGERRLERRVHLYTIRDTKRVNELACSRLITTDHVKQAHVRASQQVASVDGAYATETHERHTKYGTFAVADLGTLGATIGW